MTDKKKEQKDSRGRLRSDSQTFNTAPSLTVQSDADAADIKKILKRYKEVGIVEGLRTTEAQFRDVTELTDFADVFRVAKEAESQFMQLPSKVREIFDHDVANWLDTAHDPEKLALLVEKGEISPVKPTTPNDPPTNAPGNEDPGDET